MKSKKIELKNGIVITDSRSLGCGVSIENINTKYVTLAYTSHNGFYLNVKGVWIGIDEYPQFLKEIEEMGRCLIELTKKFN